MTTNVAQILSLAVLTVLVQLLTGGHAVGNDVTSDLAPETRIHGGTVAGTFRKFKFLVKLEVDEYFWDSFDPYNTSYHIKRHCSGALISNAWIITSVRCLPCHYLYNMFNKMNRFKKYEERDHIYVCDECCDGIYTVNGCLRRPVHAYMTMNNSVTYVGNCGAPNLTIITDVGVALLRMNSELIVRLPYRYKPAKLLTGPMPSILTEGCMAMGYGIQYEDEATGVTQWDQDNVYYVNVTVGTQIFCCWVTETSAKYEDRICTYNLRNAAAMPCRGDDGGPLVCPSSDGGLVIVGVYVGDQAGHGVRCGAKRRAWINYTSTEVVKRWIQEETLDPNIHFRTLN